jgi:hypothetical protein
VFEEGGEEVKCKLLKCSKSKNWRELASNIQLSMNKNIACKKVLNCTNVREIKEWKLLI